MNKELMNEINSEYQRLDLKKAEIVFALFHGIFETESGWYNGHYHKNGDGEWEREPYPIPVVSINGLCDMEIHFDKVTVSSKMKRNAALAYSFDNILKYEFEVYGVDDYLADFYRHGQTENEIKENIQSSNEKEIFFSFSFPFDVEGKFLYEFAKMLQREGFFY